ncbi:preprotein translocase subunit SecG [Devosia sp. RR2S18]|uniref:preprotein translocase subunit SecG n=1 Tax=Devosia rhizosphaerae TaxID=3049774 RepID=UPI002540E4F6|nr:preprotein translocase subunit SecG [Devosia sp. RR2S18]WIJ23589.1 preprotein translocase subunit SecG [Devosia sp. RR2S18]
MANVLIVAYLLIVLALIAVILLQRSEGGALGIGGGGGGGLMTARGSANLLTRTTAILATLFFATAIGLTILSELDRGTSGILERAAQGQDGAAPTSVLDALNSLQGTETLPVPAAETPAAPEGADPVTDPTLPLPATDVAPAAEPVVVETAPAGSSDLPVPLAPAETPAN